MRNTNPAALAALEEIHRLTDDPTRQLLFFTDLDGTLITTPAIEGYRNPLEASHHSRAGRLHHQLRKSKAEQTASMQAVVDLKSHRLLGTNDPAMTFMAIITASGMDRFVDKKALQEFFSLLPIRTD